MKSLKTLIKLHKHTLDELRRDMGVLENERSQLRMAVHRLDGDLNEEAKLANESSDLQRFFGDFAVRIKKRQAQLHEEIKKVEEKIDVLREAITREFAELKKYEVALQNAMQKEKEAKNRKETMAMDEVAGQQHQRQNQENDA